MIQEEEKEYPDLNKQMTIEEFRKSVGPLIEMGRSLSIADVLKKLGYASHNTYYHASTGKGKNELSGVEVLKKMLTCLGYEVTFYVKIKDTKKGISRDSINPRIATRVQKRNKKKWDK